MKVLVTGAFGNVGSSTIDELIRRGHQVRCFDVKTRTNERAARPYRGKCEIVWGDLRNAKQVSAAVENQDAVIHLAFVIPTLSATGTGSEEDPVWAREINVGGTYNLIEALKDQPQPPSLIFTSSLHIYGRTHDQAPPRRIEDPPQPIEHYAQHKVECEAMIKDSGLNWAVYRLGAVLPIRLILDRGMFGVPLDNRIEFVHYKDVALALANGLEEPGVWGGVWHIGGGKSCQLYQRDLVQQVLEVVGLEMLPEEAFTQMPFPTDWLDTSESQELLQFQHRNFGDYLEDLKNILGFRRRFVGLFRPLIRTWMLKQSPQWARHKAGLETSEKVAVITGASSGIGRAAARQLAASGYTTVLVSRDTGRLARIVDQIQIDGGEAFVMKADLEQEEERTRLFREISSKVGHVDVLVNSAGAGWYGYGDAMPWDEASKLIDLNIKAYAQLTLTFLAQMKERGQGHIINVSSIAGGLPSQGAAVYSATKSFVDTFTTSLHRELKDSGVYVSSVRPGAVVTPFLDPILAEFKRFGIPFDRLAIRPERVGKGIARLVSRPRRVLYIPRVLRVVPWLELSFGWFIDLLGPLLLRGRDKAAI